VILEGLISLDTHIRVKPHYFFVISAHNEVVALGVDGERRDPPGARGIFVDKGLLLQVVLIDCLVGAHEELWLG